MSRGFPAEWDLDEIADRINDLQAACEVRVYRGYSGRGMYGKEVDGLVLSGDALSGMMALGWVLRDFGEGELPDLRTDNLARDTIIY